jgi:hypothetical protein
VVFFPGAGTSSAAAPLNRLIAVGPETADACSPSQLSAERVPAQPATTTCFFTADDPTVPAATIEQVVEVVGTDQFVRVRLTLNPDFVDNSFGETAIGWQQDDAAQEPAPAKEKKGRRGGAHSFKDLVGSDHAEIKLLDAGGNVAMHFRIDFISEDDRAPSGYASLGISAGDGELFVGNEEWLLASTTSLDRNLNACGLGEFIEDSPAADDLYLTNSASSDWDYRVAYEVWVSVDAFGAAGFGQALIDSVHASPSKSGDNSEEVTPAPCPPDDQPLDDSGIPLEPPPYTPPTIR